MTDAGTAGAAEQAAPDGRRNLRTTISDGLAALWGAVTGLAPHVLHHVGPLAGTALVAGAGGQILFAVVGFLVTIPLLVRLRRRTGGWAAPAGALVLFAVLYTVSTLVIGPRISGTASSAEPTEHEQHEQHTEARGRLRAGA